MANLVAVEYSPYYYYDSLNRRLADLHARVTAMRSAGALDARALTRIREYFKIKGIYNSNAIEGNTLTVGETRLVVEMGLTISGKSLKDQAEAKNLSEAVDFMEQVAVARDTPILIHDLRQVHALILKDIDNNFAGRYRETEVRISGSAFNPPESHLVPQEMAELGEYLAEVSLAQSDGKLQPVLCAAAAHAWLARIHPFVDGNGRTARILMNLVLMRNGYPICVLTRDDRMRYYQALEDSQAGDLTPLAELVSENVEDAMQEWQIAAADRVAHTEWLAAFEARLQQPNLKRLENEHRTWLRAMDLLRSYFQQTADEWNEQDSPGAVSIKYRQYDSLDIHNYSNLRTDKSPKNTWFFGIDFDGAAKRQRYMFFFGAADQRLRRRAAVTLYIGKNIDHRFVGITESETLIAPDIFQLGFDIDAQVFVALTNSGVIETRVEDIARSFINQVLDRDFGA